MLCQKILDLLLPNILAWKFQTNENFNFINLYQKYTATTYSYLVIDATLASDNPLCFRKNIVEQYKTNHDDWW